MKNMKKNLSLKAETLRTLNLQQLGEVAGGYANSFGPSWCITECATCRKPCILPA
jgi:hypothetical protein